MLTIKQITDDKEAVISGLEKKNFSNARAAIDAVLAADNKRKTAQGELDAALAEQKTLAKSIGALMKAGNTEEAEAAKARVAELKQRSAELEDAKKEAEEERTNVLYTIPNLPYDIVPEGRTAEENEVVKTGGNSTELPENPLPHWELAKKYDLIDA